MPKQLWKKSPKSPHHKPTSPKFEDIFSNTYPYKPFIDVGSDIINEGEYRKDLIPTRYPHRHLTDAPKPKGGNKNLMELRK